MLSDRSCLSKIIPSLLNPFLGDWIRIIVSKLMNQGGDWPPTDASTSTEPSSSVPATCNAAMTAVASTVSSASLSFAAASSSPLFASTSRSLSFPGDAPPLGLQLPTTAAAPSSSSLLQQFLAFRYRCLQCTFATADLIAAHQHNLTAHNTFNGSVFDTLNPTGQPDLLSAQSALLLSSAAALPGPPTAPIPTPPLATTVLPAPPPDPTLVQQQIQQHYESLAPEGQVRCETCGKYLCKTKPLSSLINHAKRHYIDKQFNCTECAYGSSEAAHVRNHMRLRHSVVDKDPEDLRDLRLQQAWMSIATKCFPSMTENLSRFRFKRFRKRRRSVPASASTSRASLEQPSSSTSASSVPYTFESSSRTDSRSLTESPETPSAFRTLPTKSSSSI
uniref:C2H2-type domain-containing protein n=1 Tax=Steinernema glaseri TaxID=37863 RepID=A0A1I7ZWU8_9BILA